MRELGLGLLFAFGLLGCATHSTQNTAKVTAAKPVGHDISETLGGGSIRMVSQGPIRYPSLAYRNRIGGKVVLDIGVGPDGRPVSVKVYSREIDKKAVLDDDGVWRDITTIFDQPAIDSLMQSTWAFENHQPRPGRIIYFRLPLKFAPM